MDELTAHTRQGVIPLSLEALPALPQDIKVPRYSRHQQSPGIVHIGLGNFHRAHQAWYLQQLMQRGIDLDWAIIGAGVRDADKITRQKLSRQNWLSTLIELGPEGVCAEICCSMIDYVPVLPDNAPLISQIADASTRIVSLTVTEGGYFRDPGSGSLLLDAPDLQHDVRNSGAPKTAFGAIVAGLKARRQAGTGPITGLSCDNLRGNGDMLREIVVQLARQSDPALADWIEDSCTFPNSMVDCIVPATGPEELDLAHEFGIDDAAPVTHENFRQWVIEDAFAAGRPRWDEVGVTLSGQVQAYEAMKLRVLNGGHQIIAVPGDLLGLETVAEAVTHPLIGSFLHRVAAREILPFVDPVPGMDAEAYMSLIVRRFSNPAVRDTVRRVAFDGSSRQPGFLLPSIQDGIRSGAPIEGLALASALWARYCSGVREDGQEIKANDPQWDRLQKNAQAARETPRTWLQMDDIYGDLGAVEAFAAPFAKWLRLIYREGAEAAITGYLSMG